MKKTWVDVLGMLTYSFPESDSYSDEEIAYNKGVTDSINELEAAEKRGEVCLNPPSDEELYQICGCKGCRTCKAISKRLRGE